MRGNRTVYNEYPFLDRLEKSSKYTIGNKARVPIHVGRSGSTTVLGPAGGTLNTASPQKVNEADYTLAYNWDQIGIQYGALNQVSGGNSSVVEALDLEITGKIADQRKDIVRQLLGNGDGLIAKCAANSSGQAVVNLGADTTLGNYGYSAIVRGWLRPDQTIDIGTTASPAAVGGGLVISSVSQNDSTRVGTLTLTGNLANATTTSHYVSIAGARVTTSTYETTGLRSVAGSATTTVGTLDPATYTYWQPAKVDTATTAITIDLPIAMQQAVFQVTGGFPTKVLTSIKQLSNLYLQLQNQVRFTGDLVRAGNVMSTQWNGMDIEALPDVPDNEFYMYSPDDLLIVTGKYGTATWMSDVQGTNQGLQYVQGGTSFVDSIAYALGLGVRRRNSHAAAIGLIA